MCFLLSAYLIHWNFLTTITPNQTQKYWNHLKTCSTKARVAWKNMSLVDAVGDSAKSGDLDLLGGWAPMTDGYVVRMGPPFINKP